MSEVWIDLFTRLPDEVLELILSNVTSPQDQSSITKASSVCGNILHPRKPHFLFHDIIPYISPYLVKSELLSTRLVCTEWKHATDTYLENSEMFNDEMYFRKYSPYWPRRSRSITDFLSAFQPPSNPFPGRRAAFGRIRREAPDFDYWQNVTFLLKKFGTNLTTLHLDFEDTPFSTFIAALTDCLSNVKNLKQIQIVYFGRPSASTDPSTLTLRSLFPPLPSLEHIELNGTFPCSFYNTLLSAYSRSLTSLKLHQVVPEDVHLPPTPQLKQLNITSSSISDLPRLLPSNPLTSISISIYKPHDFTLLFTHLNAYRTSLKSLKIQFDALTPPPTQLNKPTLQPFPHLTTLKLKNAPTPLLDLTLFPSVQTLEFECLEKGDFLTTQPNEDTETCGVFKICGYPANQLYNSNIWNMLPNLEHCKLSCYQLFSGRELKYVYSRAMYEYLQKCGT